MNPLKELSDKKKIKAMILIYLQQFKPGDELLTDQVIRHIKAYHRRGIKEATIDRYRRELREEGKISYDIPDKKKRIIIMHELTGEVRQKAKITKPIPDNLGGAF